MSGSEGLYFEDFRVGQVFRSAPRRVTQADVDTFIEVSGDRGIVHRDEAFARSVGFTAPVVHGPFGVAVVFGQLFEQRVVEPTAIAMLDLDWQFHRPIVVGDELRSTMTITRCRRSRTRQAGVLGRHFSLMNQDGAVVQDGTSSLMVQARAHSSGTDASVRTDFCSVDWAESLEPLLLANDGFAEAVSSFDGAIGLGCGRELVQLRLYRGKVLEATRVTPTGPTFTLTGTELAWTNLARAERNDFIARTSRGEFGVSGNVYEYLRLTKAVVCLWDSVRKLAASDGAA